jgi:MoxR-like ATPase
MELAEVRTHAGAVLDEIERSVVGKRDALQLVLAAMLCDGHVLLEDYPGLAKTLIARSFAQASSLHFARIQFTPDLMPSDVTGSSVFDQQRAAFTFLPGPIFANLLLADEINRAPPKTQAALLEAMQERQVTTEGETRVLEPPFFVLATQNPIEYEGTYPLPEAQLDRFLVRIGIGYPSRDDEVEMLSRRLGRGEDELALSPVVDTATFLEMQRALAAGSDGPAHSPYERALTRKPEPPGRPSELVRVERELTLGTSSAGQLHNRLIPLLRDAAVARLGRDLSRERLGDEAWELLRPDRPEPEDRNAPGVSLRRVRSVVSTLERL